MMYEHVVTGSTADKAIALIVVKPFYFALFFHFFLFKLLILQWQVDHLACLALLRGSSRETPTHSESAAAFMKSWGKHLIELAKLYVSAKNNSSLL
jgi:hypothetical protein